MQALRPQVVIGFGGGSAMDAAKAIVWFSQQGGLPVDTCVAIPTTSGTGFGSDQRLRHQRPGKRDQVPAVP
ncbi:propanediol utilization protein PduQ [Klebsiella pneumoniae]|nr:propanediol utilization protein PduQ [Klebsiella pneumoniae]